MSNNPIKNPDTMMYNLIITDFRLKRTRLYGSYETFADAMRDYRKIYDKCVGYTPLDCPLDGDPSMHVDNCLILDDIQYINAKF